MITSKDVAKHLFDICKRPVVPKELGGLGIMQVWDSQLCSFIIHVGRFRELHSAG